MNVHERQPASPGAMLASVWNNRALIRNLATRDIASQYRGSMAGFAWSFLTPLLMLAVYTFFFSVVFQARWGARAAESKLDFAIVLFVGLTMHGFFADCANRAPSVILANSSYVKKVVFPIEILPCVALGAALFRATVSLLVLLAAMLVLNLQLHLTALLVPLIFVPLMLITIGVSWFLAATAVYLRDIGQSVGIFTTMLLFLSPVFFPVSALPPAYQPWIRLNPLTFVIEQARDVILWGKLPDWTGLLLLTGASLLVAWAGFWWFQRTRRGFADVI